MAGFVECLDNEDIEEAVNPMEGKWARVMANFCSFLIRACLLF